MGMKAQSTGANIFKLEKQKGSKYYSMRIMHQGKRRRFSTGKSSIKDAKQKARVIMADIQSRGFEEAVKIHSKRRDQIPTDPTITEFAELYRAVSVGFDSPPSRPTRERYIRSLVRIAEASGVRLTSQLDENKIEIFKGRYLSDGRKEGRKDDSIRTSLNGILRNAAALFSTQALQGYRRHGVQLTNPFSGTQIKGVRLRPYSPLPRDLVASIWKKAALLRDGDKDADPPDATLRARDTFDFREPQPDSYMILLLELGLGLRRDEADKCQWDWFFTDHEGRRYLEVRETPYFLPKSGENRIVPVEEALWKAIHDGKKTEEFVIDGNPPTLRDPERDLKSKVYRCDRAHRTLVAWLRKMGITNQKPCHTMRKEFGSYVATSFGLYHAQKLLGHSSPSVTSAFYAGLTELPFITPSQMARSHGKEKKKNYRTHARKRRAK